MAPGITPAKVASLRTLLDAYTAVAANPGSQQTSAFKNLMRRTNCTATSRS